MNLVHQRVMEVLGKTGPEQMEQNLRALRIVLVLGIMHDFARSRHGNRRNKLEVNPSASRKWSKAR